MADDIEAAELRRRLQPLEQSLLGRNHLTERAAEVIRAVQVGSGAKADSLQQAIRTRIDGLQDTLAEDEQLWVYCTDLK